MAKLICVPLGSSARDCFAQDIAQLPFGEGVLVLPNRLLMDDVRARYAGVEVVGMDTLANKLLNINGYVNFTEISRRSQELIVQDIVEYMVEETKQLQKMRPEDKRELTYFARLKDKPGFIKSMTSLVGQLSRSGATAEEIKTALDSWDGRDGYLKSKDEGVGNLYLLYRQYLKNNKWYDLEGKYRLALQVLHKEKPNLIWRKIYISDFYTLDNLQIMFLQKLAQFCDVTIGMCYENSMEKKYFAASDSTHKALLAAAGGFSEAKLSAANCCDRPKNDDLQYLCQHFGTDDFAAAGQGRPAASSIFTYEFASRDKELHWVLANVKKQLRGGVPAANIAVTVRDMESCSGLRQLADEYGIPLSLPQTSVLALQPLAELLRFLLAAHADTADGAAAYFSLMEHGLLALLTDGVPLRLAAALPAERYFASRRAAQQSVRQLLGEPQGAWLAVDEFIAGTRQQDTVEGYINSMLQFLTGLQLKQRLGRLYKAGAVQLDALAACLKTCGAVEKCLQQLLADYKHCNRAQDKLKLGEWASLLNEALAGTQITLQHGRRDGVLVTSVVNMQGLHFDYVYIMGLCEGEFPKVGSEDWIYNDRERELIGHKKKNKERVYSTSERGELKTAGLDLPNIALEYAEDAFFFASTLACAGSGLYLTWSNEDHKDDGAASAYVGSVQKLFANFADEEQKKQLQTPPEQEFASPQDLQRLGRAVDGSWLAQQADAALLQALHVDEERGAKPAYNGGLQDAAKELDLRRTAGSVFSASSLETYANCPFRYLGSRIWRQQQLETKDDTMHNDTKGTLLHAVLAKFIGGHLNEKLTQYSLDELTEELQLDFEDCCTDLAQKNNLADSVMWQAEQPALWRTLQDWLQYEYAEQKQWEGFVPAAVEWDFSARENLLKLQLGDGTAVSLRGRIDRIDSDGERVVITDYKSHNVPGKSAVGDGLDLQMPVYLLAADSLYAGGSHVSGGSYMSLEKTKRVTNHMLEDVQNANIKDSKYAPYAEGWENFVQQAHAFLTGYIEAVYQGDFAVRPKECSEYCPLKDICRKNDLAAPEQKGEECDE